MNIKWITGLVLCCLTTISSCSQQKNAVNKIKAAALDSTLRLPEKLQQQLSLIKPGSAHLIFSGGDEILTETGSRWLAAKQKQPVYKVDLAAVTGKYIAETEKNLDKIFTDAAAGNALLLFDEADALFGKRTDVKDAHDKYSNAEVSYLLKRIETYRGSVIIHCKTNDCIKQTAQAGLVKIVLQ